VRDDNGFGDLGVDARIVEVLAADGVTDPFPIQATAIPDAIAGRDVCGKARTGSGKTLAFGVPILQRVERAQDGHPHALVLVPTRELAAQVAGVLEPLAKSIDVRLAVCYGGAPLDRQQKAVARADVVVATPGRLIDLLERRAVALDRIAIVVVDEADRMADLGFLPQVEWLLRRIDGRHQTLLFSATLDGGVKALIDRYQTDPVFHDVVEGQAMVAEMTHRFLLVHEMDKLRVAAAVCRSAPRVLVFSRTKRGADRVARDLRGEGVASAAIHGDLRQVQRETSLARFSEGKVGVLVATDVAGRGIHIDDVDVVMHYDPPQDHKEYLHRSGRTARAGAGGLVVSLVLWNEELLVRRLQRALGLDEPIVEIFSNNPHLADLGAWDTATVVA
jgi:superfamily II DNA/RNA helicase